MEVVINMALNVPTGDCIVVFQFSITGFSDPLVCTMGAGLEPDTDVSTALANDFFGDFSGQMLTSVAPECTFVNCTLYQSFPLGFVVAISDDAPVIGTGSGSAMPPNNAVMVNKITARPGRSGRGRFFLPGVGENQATPAGVLSGAYLTQVNGDLSSFRTAILGNSAVNDLLLFHDENNVDPDPTIIDSFAADSRTSSMAKRFRRNS